MRLGFGLGVTMLNRPAVAVVAALISAVNGDGWSAEWASGTPPTFTPDTSPQTITVNRAGFDAAGGATTIADTLTFLTRVTQPYNNYGTPTPTTVALSDYIYAGDAVAGVTNNASDPSPKPICAPSMPHRLRVGNTIGGTVAPYALVAHHRDARQGKPVAAVKVIISDSGGNSKTVTIAAPVVTLRSGMPALIEYVLPETDISTFANGLITVNAEVYPHFGTGASVAKSASDGNAARGFAPRYYLKTATAPTYVYVSSSGNDTSGVASTDASTALATPCLTVMGAMAKGVASAGVADHVIVRVLNSVGMGSSSAARAQNVAAVIVEAAPSVSQANAVVTISAAGSAQLSTGLTIPTNEGGLLFRNLTINRTANVLFSGNSTYKLEVQLDNVAFAFGGVTGAWLANASDAFFGCAITGNVANTFAEGTSFQRRCFRHTSIGSGGVVQLQLVIGCTLTTLSNSGTPLAGQFVGFNRFINNAGGLSGVTQSIFVQNVFEFTSATTNPALRISSDSGTDSTVHVCIHNNTFAGAARGGRWNVFYDETPGGVRRTHKFISIKGTNGVSLFTKSSEFLGKNGNGSPDTANAPSATGNWPMLHGVGCAGNVFLFSAATPVGGSEAQYFPGLKTSIGATDFVPTQPVTDMFTDPKAVTVSTGGSYTAGAGNGDYTLKTGSIAKARLASALLPYDLAGTARPLTNDSAGAYA